MFSQTFLHKIKKETDLYKKKLVDDIISTITNSINLEKSKLKNKEIKKLTFEFDIDDFDIVENLFKIFEYKNCKYNTPKDTLYSIKIDFNIVGETESENEKTDLLCQHC